MTLMQSQKTLDWKSDAVSKSDTYSEHRISQCYSSSPFRGTDRSDPILYGGIASVTGLLEQFTSKQHPTVRQKHAA
jgi:hypothetical protein